jgi:hypothetical protein
MLGQPEAPVSKPLYMPGQPQRVVESLRHRPALTHMRKVQDRERNL